MSGANAEIYHPAQSKFQINWKVYHRVTIWYKTHASIGTELDAIDYEREKLSVINRLGHFYGQSDTFVQKEVAHQCLITTIINNQLAKQNLSREQWTVNGENSQAIQNKTKWPKRTQRNYVKKTRQKPKHQSQAMTKHAIELKHSVTNKSAKSILQENTNSNSKSNYKN